MRRVMSGTSSAALIFSAMFGLVACGSDSGGQPVAEPAWAAAPYVQYVDPFIGSGGVGYSFGSALTGAVAPFGLVRLAPDTSTPAGFLPFHHFSGYHYDDSIVLGFSHLHFHGTGAPGYGNLLFMPVPGFTPDKITPGRYRSPFVKADEVATPGYYATHLVNGAVRAELTTSGRAGLHRYEFGDTSNGAAVVIDAGYRIPDGFARDIQMTLDPVRRRITGRHHSPGGLSRDFDLFWVIYFDTPLSGFGTWHGSTVTAGSTTVDAATGGGGAYLEFDIPDGATVQFRVGLSLVDLEGAENNLAAEAPDFEFDAVHAATAARWETLLSRLKIEETDPSALRKFYSAAYRSLIMPTIFSDADGRYRGFDQDIHVADGFDYYSDLSLWDTFRTLHPWLTLAYPEIQNDIITSLLKMYEQDGFLPIWPVATRDSGTMIGASAEILIADSFVKGLRDFDVELAYEAATLSGRTARPAGSSSPGRRHIRDYLDLGYVPVDSAEKGASMTLEYAASDGALSQFAAALGRHEDATEFAARAENYRNLWDPETSFFRTRHRDGSFQEPFDPNEWDIDYTESTAWQYLFYVPHDPQGLIELFGGRERFVEVLEDFFAASKIEHDSVTPITRYLFKRLYWAGNEPDIHTAYLFNDAGRPDLAGFWARWALDASFGDGPDGLPGNDDCGTMSAWYLFTALGFYPVPGYDKYYVGAPTFSTAQIDLPQGAAFRITAPAVGADLVRPRVARLSGRVLPEFTFRHTDIAAGAVLDVELE